jgi:hypothetical protein
MMLRIDTNTRGNRLLGSTTAERGGDGEIMMMMMMMMTRGKRRRVGMMILITGHDAQDRHEHPWEQVARVKHCKGGEGMMMMMMMMVMMMNVQSH